MEEEEDDNDEAKLSLFIGYFRRLMHARLWANLQAIFIFAKRLEKLPYDKSCFYHK